jgi:hypothetical protein
MEKDVDVLNGGERRVLQGVEISVHVSMRAAFVVVVVVVCVCVCVWGGGGTVSGAYVLACGVRGVMIIVVASDEYDNATSEA